MPSTFTRKRRAPGLGESVLRPDAPAKTKGQFAFSSDLWMERMLWGATLRSPHPSARIRSLDPAPALAIGGVHAVITNDDLWGSRTYGLEHHDQPVFADQVVRYHGEPVAAVAADHPEIARRAAAAIAVDYDVLDPLVDSEAAITAPPIHPDGNLFRHLKIRFGDPGARGEVVVEGDYEVGMQDQAFLGPESGLAVPSEDGGVELYVATQWLHVDRDQIAACLNLPREKVRLTLAGTGGAFGGREDLSMQIHACLLALVTRRPVKMVYSREESFFGHVHRHPARLWYRHHATRDGRLVNVESRMVFDGGAYASSSTAVISNACAFAPGPYFVPNAKVDGYAVRTNNPPCGAMRGFGAVQTSFAAEAQMDKLAEALGMDPVELRLRNALKQHDKLITGQVIIGTAPVAECITACRDLPLPEPLAADAPALALPGGAGLTALAGDVRRGVGFAVGFKNLGFSEGFDDYSTARVRLELGPADEPLATVHLAPTEPLDENGQGNAHWSLAFAAHRAVVDVDPELGLVKIVQIATAQDIGKALNPLAVTGQIEGGIAQGIGLAVMEEIVLDQGKVRNPSFTDYLLPTALDMPPVVQTWIEQPERGAPYGAKGVGEPPTVSSTGAVVAAIRQATGLPLRRVPVRPDDIALAPQQ
jgi:CO/xanthine dehydrogenase Mo-binding subunit